MRTLCLSAILLSSLAIPAGAATIYPLDRATIMAGSPFDLKVEFDAQVAPRDVSVTIDGQPAAKVLGKELSFVATEQGTTASAVLARSVMLAKPGRHSVTATAGGETKTVAWDVYATPAKAKAKNVIFFLGDGLSVSFRTAARIMSRGMTEGKADGRLAMDDLDHMAFIGTSSTGAIATDSANTMSAYMTGHKSAVNALGVYADRTPDSLDDPRVENIAEALRRTTKKSLGVVVTSELEDATPAAVFAHTRKRADKAIIAEQIMALKPEVILGGGSAYYLPQNVPGSKRKDSKDLVGDAKAAGYALATNAAEMRQAPQGKLLGLFHTGNMDYALDRLQLKKGTVSKFPDQPGLVEMTKVALDRLSKNKDGFFLMVEGSCIDKAAHPMDWERAIVDTIEFDDAIAAARDFVKTHPDTLIVVTGDHTHAASLIGTIDDNKPGTEMREKVGTYAAAGFPNYTHANGSHYPDTVDVSRRLAMFAADFPDYYETFRPKMDGPFEPAVQNEKKQYVANEAYKDIPGAVLRHGNIPRNEDTAVHSVDDVVLQAAGPGAEEFKGYMEESDVYRVLADAMALAPTRRQ